MTQERTIISARVRSLAKVPWDLLALAAVLVLSAFLNLFRLTSEGYGNPFYAAAVKDMLVVVQQVLLSYRREYGYTNR